MQSLWSDADATRGGNTPLDLRVYTSRLLGREPSLVLHGGGNTSVKATETNLFGDVEEIIYVKGTGWDLATIERAGFAPVRLDPLRRLAELQSLSDTEMVKAQRAAMTDPGAPTPSVEAILHAIIPFAFVDHTHADAVVAITNTEGGEGRIREIYGSRVLVVPYVMPGFILARTVRELTRDLDWSRLEGMILLQHGVFSFGPDARTSYERMIRLVSDAEAYLAKKAERSERTEPARNISATAELLAGLATLRQAVGRARGGAVVARWDRSPAAVSFSTRADIVSVAARGPLTPDHVIRTKPVPLVDNGDWTAAVDRYASRYREYFVRHASSGLAALDPAPRWIIWPGQGFVTLGTSTREAGVAADIAVHTAQAIEWAEQLGGWRPLPEAELFQVEYWELEQAKLRTSAARPLLAGKVAIVTGAASGIGRACVEALHAQGAAVVGTDVNPAVTALAKEGLIGLVADATDSRAVQRSVEETVERFGGVDIVVSNAGVFSQGQRIEEMSEAIWEQSLALNLSSHLHLIRSATPFLRLGFDPAIVVVGSKNVPAPGPSAGAYSVAKAGLTQLARVAALELAKDGIRVNVLHPHAVFDTAAWTQEVLASRAASYGMTVEEYRRNNLLGVEITSRDVAAAVLALAGPTFTKTTGAQIPIDGGSDRVV